MHGLSVYLSFSSEAHAHGVAVGKVLDTLQCRHVDGVSHTATGTAAHQVLVRILTLASVHAANMAADIKTFTRYDETQGERHVIALIMEPGYVVWPELLPCPITYINTIGRPYTEWVRELEAALADGQEGTETEDYDDLYDEYFGEEDVNDEDYLDDEPC